MERILLGVLFLSGWSMCLKRPLRQYHYVPKTMTWTEAQTYCRQNYADLATIENTEEMDQMNTIVSSAESYQSVEYSESAEFSGSSESEVWIGLTSFINWQWSDNYAGSGAKYRHWDKNESLLLGDLYCVVSSGGRWGYLFCSWKISFICNKGTLLNPEFVHITKKMNWTSAQTYCRENFFDLATVRNEAENLKVSKLTSEMSWIGLFISLNTSWSDGSKSSFTNWHEIQDLFPYDGKRCVASSGTWRLKPCDTRLPFVCHSEPSPPVKRHVLKLKFKVDDSSVDPNDPVVKEKILKQLQDRLAESGLGGVNLTWREQADGEVFVKDSEGSEKTPKKEKCHSKKNEL